MEGKGVCVNTVVSMETGHAHVAVPAGQTNKSNLRPEEEATSTSLLLLLQLLLLLLLQLLL